MQKTSLTALSIPEQAKSLGLGSAKSNFSSSYGMRTGTIVKWSSGTMATGYPAAAMAMVHDGPWPWLALSFGIVSGFMGFVSFCISFSDSAQYMKEKFSEHTAPIERGAWKSEVVKPNFATHAYNGVKISQRNRRSLLTAFIDPTRLFRKVLLRETIWYDPARDVFTRDCSYLGAFNWIETRERYAGRRRTFLTALKEVKEIEKKG